MYFDDNVFEDNVFEHNQVGAAIMYSRRLTLRRNRFTGSRGPSAYGLLVKVADDVMVEGNWFLDNSRGVFLEDSPQRAARKRDVRGNSCGQRRRRALQPGVNRVLFTENAFVANRCRQSARPRQGENVWSVDGRGNYWSDYVGYDADGDGIGDSPFTVEQYFEHLVDRWPAVGLLRMGPASQGARVRGARVPRGQARPRAGRQSPLDGVAATRGRARCVAGPAAARARRVAGWDFHGGAAARRRAGGVA